MGEGERVCKKVAVGEGEGEAEKKMGVREQRSELTYR